MIPTVNELSRRIFPSIISEGIKITEGVGLSYGAASGQVIRSLEEIDAYDAENSYIYCAPSLSARDLVLLSQPGIVGAVIEEAEETSHEVIITRGNGKPLVGRLSRDSINSLSGEITIDGTSGAVYKGRLNISQPSIEDQEIESIIREMQESTGIIVRGNADVPTQARVARLLGAKGLGPVRTEYMFYTDGRLEKMQRFLFLKDSVEDRAIALQELAELQRQDFFGIFSEMDGYPVGIRLFDPSFYEFTPKKEEISMLAEKLSIQESEIERKIAAVEEKNPMMGIRGVRVGILYPEVYEMQLIAAFEAAVNAKKQGKNPKPDITIPFICFPGEIERIREMVNGIAKQVFSGRQLSVDYTVTAMIELPAACYQAEEIAAYVDGFSFGTNDLTQATYGMSRTDISCCLEEYKKKKIIDSSPFVVLTKPIMELILLAVERGRKSNAKLITGVCGEQAANPDSAKNCYEQGIDYVSCSPYRIPFIYQNMLMVKNE